MDRLLPLVRAFVLVAFLLLLAACDSTLLTPEGGPTPASIGPSRNGVTRYLDTEAGVVCWVFEGYQEGGISCLPVSSTRLEVG